MKYLAIDTDLLNHHVHIRTISGHIYTGKFDQLCSLSDQDYLVLNKGQISETRIAIEYIESMGPQ